MTTWINKHGVAAILKCHPGTVIRYRNDSEMGWIQDVHWVRITTQNYLYNEELIRDWIANRNDPDAHLAAIEAYRRSLSVGRKRRAG